MAQYDFSRLYEQYPAVISQMEQNFTSHAFILELAKAEPGGLYRGAARLPANAAPGQAGAVHDRARDTGATSRSYPKLIKEVNPGVASRDIFGQDNAASLWRKVG